MIHTTRNINNYKKQAELLSLKIVNGKHVHYGRKMLKVFPLATGKNIRGLQDVITKHTDRSAMNSTIITTECGKLLHFGSIHKLYNHVSPNMGAVSEIITALALYFKVRDGRVCKRSLTSKIEALGAIDTSIMIMDVNQFIFRNIKRGKVDYSDMVSPICEFVKSLNLNKSDEMKIVCTPNKNQKNTKVDISIENATNPTKSHYLSLKYGSNPQFSQISGYNHQRHIDYWNKLGINVEKAYDVDNIFDQCEPIKIIKSALFCDKVPIEYLIINKGNFHLFDESHIVGRLQGKYSKIRTDNYITIGDHIRIRVKQERANNYKRHYLELLDIEQLIS